MSLKNPSDTAKNRFKISMTDTFPITSLVTNAILWEE